MTEEPPFAAEINAGGARRRGPGPALVLVALALTAGLALGLVAAWRWGDRLGIAGRAPVTLVTPALPAPSLDLPTLSAREAALAGRLAALEARTAQVGQVAGAAGGYATRAEDLLIAQAARRQIERGLPLGYLEGEVRDRFGMAEPRAVAVLGEASRNPVTLEDLRLGLDTVGAELAYGPSGAGWLGGIEHQLANLVVLHRTGTPSPAPAERLERMRRAIGRGQVETALAEATQLPGASNGNGWMQAARRYALAEKALDAIEAAALAMPNAPPAAAPVSVPAEAPATPTN